MSEINYFDPVSYSNAENEFLLDNLDKPTIVALREVRPPVNPKAVKPVLDRLQELRDLETHEGLKWVGTAVIRASIRSWLEQNRKWAADHKRAPRRVPRWPSMYSYDAKGRPHWGGPGSDSGGIKSYFQNGKRVSFAVPLVAEDDYVWTPPVMEASETMLKVNEDLNRIECPIQGCGHTENFKEGSRPSKAAARARMSKHLRKATKEVDAHRELHTLEFGAASAI